MSLAPSAHGSPAPLTMLASNVPFDILFGIFVLALLTLVVIVIAWAIRRDRAGRAAWVQRQQGKTTGTATATGTGTGTAADTTAADTTAADTTAADRDLPPTLGE